MNQKDLKEILKKVILPRKGKLSGKVKAEQCSEEFIKAKHQHSAAESAINGLEHTGLDRCRDKDIDGFKRYVSLSVLARNLHTLGGYIKMRELALEKRRKKLSETWEKKRQLVLVCCFF